MGVPWEAHHRGSIFSTAESPGSLPISDWPAACLFCPRGGDSTLMSPLGGRSMQLVCCLEKVGSWWLVLGPQNPGGSRTAPPTPHRAGPCRCQTPGACYLPQGRRRPLRLPRPLHEASEHVNGVGGRPAFRPWRPLGQAESWRLGLSQGDPRLHVPEAGVRSSSWPRPRCSLPVPSCGPHGLSALCPQFPVYDAWSFGAIEPVVWSFDIIIIRKIHKLAPLCAATLRQIGPKLSSAETVAGCWRLCLGGGLAGRGELGRLESRPVPAACRSPAAHDCRGDERLLVGDLGPWGQSLTPSPAPNMSRGDSWLVEGL